MAPNPIVVLTPEQLQQMLERAAEIGAERGAARALASQSDSLLTFDEVKQRYGIGRSKLYELTREGRLHPAKIGKQQRFPESEIRALIGEQKRTA